MKNLFVLLLVITTTTSAGAVVGLLQVTPTPDQFDSAPPVPESEAGVSEAGVQTIPQPGIPAIPDIMQPLEIQSDVSPMEMVGHDQVVGLQSDGTLQGRISKFGVDGVTEPASLLEIRFMQFGGVAAITIPGDDGSFTVSGLTPGMYSMIAEGPDGYVAWSTYVTNDPAAGGIDTVVIPIEDLALGVANPNLLTAPESSPEPAFNELSIPITSGPVVLDADGKLRGTFRNPINPIMTDLTVVFVHDGAIVDSTRVAQNGYFESGVLNPGVYSVIGRGGSGSIAFSVEVAANPAAANVDLKSKYVPVAYYPEGLQINGLIVPNSPPLPEMIEGCCEEPIAIGGIGGIGGVGAIGGGGGGGGAFGGGGLLGLAGLGLGIAAIVDNGDDNQIPNRPSSPAAP